MSGFKYAFYQLRLYIAQIFLGWAVRVTPVEAPEFYALFECVKKWHDLAKSEPSYNQQKSRKS